MEKPKCPYCGGEMALTNKSTRDMGGSLRFFYACIKCDSESPKVLNDPEAAYAAAMKRDRAKGEWTYGNGETLWTCSVCGNDSCCKGNYCPDCGAEMREHPETDMMTAKYALPRIDFEEGSEQ